MNTCYELSDLRGASELVGVRAGTEQCANWGGKLQVNVFYDICTVIYY